MSAVLRAVSRRIRLALHRHDPDGCWCELTAYRSRPATFCICCGESDGHPHERWCCRRSEATGGTR